MPYSFTFSLDSFQITDTRSLHDDSDYVSFTLVVNPAGGKGTPQTLVKSVGALNNGVHNVELSFQNVAVNPADTVVLNYIVLNCDLDFNGKGRVLIEETMEGVGGLLSTLVSVPKPPAGDIRIPQLSSAMGVLNGWLDGQFYNLIQDDAAINVLGGGCDGTVAVEQSSFTGQDLLNRTSAGRFNQVTGHAGNPSPHGCGRNSHYVVNWHISYPHKVVPNVVDLPVKKAEAALVAAGLSWRLVSGSKTGLVTQQSIKSNTLVDAATQVLLTLDNNR